MIVAGRYLVWKRDLPDIPHTDYDVQYDMGGQTVEGSHDGDHWVFEVNSATATTMTPQRASRWSLIVIRKSDSESSEIGNGFVDIFATTDDRSTHAEQMVVKIESVLHGRADHDIESYSIKGRSLTRMSVRELTQWRSFYLNEIASNGGSTTQSGARSNSKLRARFI